MKIKKNYPEYNDWQTIDQWNKQGKTVIDESKIETLYPSQMACSSQSYYNYASPDNVRDMTEEERTVYKDGQRQKAKLQREKSKKKKEAEKENYEYYSKLREEYHTEWQWLSMYHRRIKAGATWKSGQELNPRGVSSPFGKDYYYCHISETEEITDIEEWKRLIDESNAEYMNRK